MRVLGPNCPGLISPGKSKVGILPGQIVNLGIGLPTQLMAYLAPDADVLIHSENGVLGCGPQATAAEADPRLIDLTATVLKEFGIEVESLTGRPIW